MYVCMHNTYMDICIYGLLLLGAKLDPKNSKYNFSSSIANKRFSVFISGTNINHSSIFFFLKTKQKKTQNSMPSLTHISMTSYLNFLLHASHTTTTSFSYFISYFIYICIFSGCSILFWLNCVLFCFLLDF